MTFIDNPMAREIIEDREERTVCVVMTVQICVSTYVTLPADLDGAPDDDIEAYCEGLTTDKFIRNAVEADVRAGTYDVEKCEITQVED